MNRASSTTHATSTRRWNVETIRLMLSRPVFGLLVGYLAGWASGLLWRLSLYRLSGGQWNRQWGVRRVNDLGSALLCILVLNRNFASYNTSES